MPLPFIYIVSGMLFIGALPLPYSYYGLLRLVVCGTFGFGALIAYDRREKSLIWIYGFLAVLFNPIIKIHLPKEVWVVVDVAAGVLLLATKKRIEERGWKE